MPSTPQRPYDLRPSKLRGFDDYKDLARWLCEEIEHAENVRGHIDGQLDYWHRIYEQNRTRLYTHRPKPDAADLTSPIGTQYVDSLHARTMATIFGVDPIWTVEGWAESVQQAPFVEEFHQWTAEDERVQSYVDKAIQNSWIDAVGILECYEETDYRPVRKTIWAQTETTPDPLTGQPITIMGEDNQPKLMMNRGKYVEVQAPMEGQPVQAGVAQVEIDEYEPVRVGPGYSVIDYRDFLVLPGHARDRRDIWGYAKRFWRRFTYLEQKAKDGLYDKKALEEIDRTNERDTDLDDARRETTVAQQDGQTAEKLLWEIAFLRDLDGKGERWWVATVHVGHRVLLRLKYDDLGTQIGFGRFVRFVPLPRKNSVDGLSVVGHKLITLIEEHTAIRNMRADRSALATQVPLKRMQNALWDPEEQPFGVGAVIDVREQNEVTAFEIPDVPASVNVWERSVFDACERTMGVNDIAAGVTPSEDRTLGERQMQAGYSEVRMNLIVRRLQESMEELGQIRHIIWKRVMQDQGEMAVPHKIMVGMEARGQDVSQLSGGQMTAQLLEGKFKFKPKGSVETADNGRQRQDFVQFMQILPSLIQHPAIMPMMQQPNAGRALLEKALTVFRFEDKQSILGVPGQMAGQTSQLIQDPAIQQILQQFGGGPSPMGASLGPAGGMGAPSAAPPMPEQMGGLGMVQ